MSDELPLFPAGAEEPLATSPDWIYLDELVQRFRTAARFSMLRNLDTLSSQRLEESKALQRLLGRPIRFEPHCNGQSGHSYWRPDVERIEEALKPWDEFTEGTDTWVPYYLLKTRYPFAYENLDHWFIRKRCSLLPDGRMPERKQFLTWATGNAGLSFRWFYLKSDLDLIEKTLSDLAAGGHRQETVSHPEALALGYTSFMFWAVAKELRKKENREVKEKRPVERNGRKMCYDLATVPLAALQKAKQITDVGEVITVSEASRLTQGAFSVTRMKYWEGKAGCPFRRGKPLTVVYRDAVVRATFLGGNTTRRLKDVKHYLKSEILEAWRNFKRLAEHKGIHIDVHGDTWLTDDAAFPKYEVYGQALGNWREKGWLDAKRLKRHGSGRYKKVWYYRELGGRGIAGLVKLRREGDGHIVAVPEAGPEVAPGAENRSSENSQQPREPLEREEPSERIGNLQQVAETLARLLVPLLAPPVAEHVANHLREQNLVIDADPPEEPEWMTFPPGQFTHRGSQPIPLSGKPWQVLRALYRAPDRTLTLEELHAAIWGNENPTGEESVRTHVCTARNALRAAGIKGLIKPSDPIPCTNRGAGLTAWRLDIA